MRTKRLLSTILLIALMVSVTPASPTLAKVLPSQVDNMATAAICPAQSYIGALVRFTASRYDIRIRLVYQDVTGNWLTLYYRPMGGGYYTGASPYRTSPNFYQIPCGNYKLRYDLINGAGQVYSGYLGNAFYVNGTSNYWFEFQL